MRLGRATVVRERANVRIGVNLIAGASEETAAVIIAQVVAKRGLGAAAKRSDVRSGGSGLEDGITNLQGAAIPDVGNETRVATQGTIGHPRQHVAVGIDGATAQSGQIAAHGAVDQGHRPAAGVIGGAANAAAVAVRRGVIANMLLTTFNVAKPLLSARLTMPPPKPFEFGAELPLRVLLITVNVALLATPSL